MRGREEVSPAKLRGGYYTPAPLVAACLERAAAAAGPDAHGLRVLEPSAGDGAFLRALARPQWRERVASVVALEPAGREADAARAVLGAAGLAGEVRVASAVAWAAESEEAFDLAVGNPPFVRYQFVPAADRAAADALGRRLRMPLAGVSNLWIPVLLGALSRLRDGGAFAFVVPAECLTGCAAAAVRRWLLAECRAVRLDDFARGTFPGVLQDVVVLSGRRGRGPAVVRLGGHAHAVAGDGPWTRYRLAPAALAALEVAALRPLGELARFEVSIVTGANAFFSITDRDRAAHGLEPWARPLLPRGRHAPGLRVTGADHAAARAAGARAWLLDFAAGAPVPQAGAAAYLARGEADGTHERYKCRIRRPWYRVPGVRAGELLLSKRSHRHPRVLVNEAGLLTTDTIYRGTALGGRAPAALATAFHNTATLLSAELEGRSFGGGVLELVPSEIARVAVPDLPGLAAELGRLDAIARRGPAERLVAATDALLVRAGALDPAALELLRDARAAMLDRRLAPAPRPAAAAA